jgi:hypothetical protein
MLFLAMTSFQMNHLTIPFFSFLSLLRQRKKQRKATFVESLRATKEARRCLRKASITCMALVLTLPGNSVVPDQAYGGSIILHLHQS